MLQALPLVESGAADGARRRAAGAGLRLAPGRGDARRAGGALARRPRARRARPALRAADARRRRRSGRRLRAAAALPCQLHNNCSGKHAGLPDAQPPARRRHRIRRDRPSGAAGGARRLRGDVRRREPRLGHRRLLGAEFRHHASTAWRWRWRGWPTRAGSAPAREAAARRLVAAMVAHPLLVAGEGRACSELMAAMRGAVAVKTGAEAVYRRDPAGARPRRGAEDRGRRHPRPRNARSRRCWCGSARSPPTIPAAAAPAQPADRQPPRLPGRRDPARSGLLRRRRAALIRRRRLVGAGRLNRAYLGR